MSVITSITLESGYLLIATDGAKPVKYPIADLLRAEDIPDLAASQITSGELSASRIPNISADKITSGTFGSSRIADAAITHPKLASPDVPYVGVYGRSEYGRSVYGTA